jgi:hypothetical protein
MLIFSQNPEYNTTRLETKSPFVDYPLPLMIYTVLFFSQTHTMVQNIIKKIIVMVEKQLPNYDKGV